MNKSKAAKKIIIIGSGISGLSAGIFGQNNGFLTEIFEKNPVSGGLCSSWERPGMLVDGCIHWLTGTGEKTPLRNLWSELRAFSEEEIISPDNFGTIECDGQKVVLWNNLNKLYNELISISPEDKKIIKKLIKYIVKFQNMHLPIEQPVSTMNLFDFLQIGFSMIPYLPSYIKCTKIQLSDFANKFKSPVLKNCISKIVPGEVNLYCALYAYGSRVANNAGLLKGGSKTLVKNLENSYEKLGGKIHLNSEVKNFIFENKKVIGIETKNDEKFYADYVVSAMDPFNTLSLLPNSCSCKFFTSKLHNKNYPIPSCLLASFEVDKNELEKLNISSSYEFFIKPFLVGKTMQNSIKLHSFMYDSSFIKDNKTLVTVLLPQYADDYEYWNSFNSKAEYTDAKNEIGNKIKNEIINHFPSLKNGINLIDVCTEKTFEKYVHSYKGAYQSFMWTSKGKLLTHNGKIKNAKNLILASQWSITPGGLPPAMLSGKFAIQRILKKEHRKHKITKRIKYRFEFKEKKYDK